MSQGAEHLQVLQYYERSREWDRLAEGRGRLEFLRTTEIVLRNLPPPPAVVADIGGGPGRYTRWLAERGYQVEHRDLVPRHVQELTQNARDLPGVRTAVADARDLDLADGAVDAVLLLGPLYHLSRRADRLRALAEANRVVRPGGLVFAAAVSRWAPRILTELRARLYTRIPELHEAISRAERTGELPRLTLGSWFGYCHRPQQLRAELNAVGLDVTDLVSVDIPALLMADITERMNDPVDRAVVLDAARALERVPEMLGLGPHLLATATSGNGGRLAFQGVRRSDTLRTRRSGEK
jgi:SAM-dependent methyltransferase